MTMQLWLTTLGSGYKAKMETISKASYLMHCNCCVAHTMYMIPSTETLKFT